jgi:hypothetical protein
MGLTIGTEGDLGDMCYLLAILSELPGGPHTLLLQPSRVTKGGGIIRSAHLVTDLVLQQDYIADCRPQKPGEHCDWNSGNFRGGGFHVATDKLLNAHLRHLIKTLNIGHGITGNAKWLSAKPSEDSAGRVAINCTERYPNEFFPWQEIVTHYGSAAFFVGTEREHQLFASRYGAIEYKPTANLLELAELISGCELFIGNQSVAHAIAEGLKKPLIQQTSLALPDCIFMRQGAQHVDTGNVVLPAVGDIPEKVIHSPLVDRTPVATYTTPTDGWQYRGMKSDTWIDLLNQCRWNNTPLSGKELEEDIKKENVRRAPEFFIHTIIKNRFSLTETARQNAGYPARTIREMAL